MGLSNHVLVKLLQSSVSDAEILELLDGRTRGDFDDKKRQVIAVLPPRLDKKTGSTFDLSTLLLSGGRVSYITGKPNSWQLRWEHHQASAQLPAEYKTVRYHTTLHLLGCQGKVRDVLLCETDEADPIPLHGRNIEALVCPKAARFDLPQNVCFVQSDKQLPNLIYAVHREEDEESRGALYSSLDPEHGLLEYHGLVDFWVADGLLWVIDGSLAMTSGCVSQHLRVCDMSGDFVSVFEHTGTEYGFSGRPVKCNGDYYIPVAHTENGVRSCSILCMGSDYGHEFWRGRAMSNLVVRCTKQEPPINQNEVVALVETKRGMWSAMYGERVLPPRYIGSLASNIALWSGQVLGAMHNDECNLDYVFFGEEVFGHEESIDADMLRVYKNKAIYPAKQEGKWVAVHDSAPVSHAYDRILEIEVDGERPVVYGIKGRKLFREELDI